MARSGLTISNQDRLRRYNEERLQEERNDVVQQAELYGYLAEENKLDAQATSLARLAKNVFKKSFDLPKIDEKAIFKEITKAGNTILDSIKAGKLDELVKSIIAIPANQLNARQKIIQKDLTNPEFKKTVNDSLMEDIAAGKTPEEIDESLKELVAGSEGKADLEDMASKASLKIDTNIPSSVKKQKKVISPTFSDADTINSIMEGDRPLFYEEFRKFPKERIAQLINEQPFLKSVKLENDSGKPINMNTVKSEIWKLLKQNDLTMSMAK